MIRGLDPQTGRRLATALDGLLAESCEAERRSGAVQIDHAQIEIVRAVEAGDTIHLLLVIELRPFFFAQSGSDYGVQHLDVIEARWCSGLEVMSRQRESHVVEEHEWDRFDGSPRREAVIAACRARP